MGIRRALPYVKMLALCTLLMCSCSTPKEISYFQDLRYGDTTLAVTGATEIQIQPKDKLSIIVSSQDPRLTNLFNLPIISQQVGVESTYSQNRGLSGYTVDAQGYIDFPVLGRVHVQGLTREQVSKNIKQQLTDQNLVKDPVVTVEFMNLTVSVMGEVNKPGRYNIDKDRITILDALSMAGDLNIYGKRENVLVLRSEGGMQHSYTVNLCNAGDVYSSPVFYLKQNDIVYVEPNATKARQSTVNGNNVRSTSFWISLASLLTSVAVLIFK